MSVSCNCGVFTIPPEFSNAAVYLQYLTPDEARQIHKQFKVRCLRPVLWTGMHEGLARQWANKRGMQTLITAMGPLMQTNNPSCLKLKKSPTAWSKYMKGVSAIFAQYAIQGEVATVLSPPPPERFHPSGWTNFQSIEEPILKGQFGGPAVARIELIHPGVPGAEDFRYEFWPVDEASLWTKEFGTIDVGRPHWRKVKSRPPQSSLQVTIREIMSDRNAELKSFLVQCRTHGERSRGSQSNITAVKENLIPAKVAEKVALIAMTMAAKPVPMEPAGKVGKETASEMINTKKAKESKNADLTPAKTTAKDVRATGTQEKEKKEKGKMQPAPVHAHGKMINKRNPPKTEKVVKLPQTTTAAQNGQKKGEKKSSVKSSVKQLKPGKT
ncbi:uncharacterized protein Z519_11618 [Cladophialophora bantiana CBS 173.52]|uniref:Uncharacterized protein n=1 Tax=Cladophialophora bantiana (strain ATCC 10958 / CBS 173.52 / CDC B-1940 / NIH 8579) TaxID=1442370 RepID=A0A0D2HT76_CLAB1|nr:uncharacterized protein Z519_11618 [Cladophialophora bantiana CBS 173.52]KIW87644.1 hypothetical protein Z519_11618 [Cladophialophora bantiana CBS 173.52]